jgi:hypothetical protein
VVNSARLRSLPCAIRFWTLFLSSRHAIFALAKLWRYASIKLDTGRDFTARGACEAR